MEFLKSCSSCKKLVAWQNIELIKLYLTFIWDFYRLCFLILFIGAGMKIRRVKFVLFSETNWSDFKANRDVQIRAPCSVCLIPPTTSGDSIRKGPYKFAARLLGSNLLSTPASDLKSIEPFVLETHTCRLHHGFYCPTPLTKQTPCKNNSTKHPTWFWFHIKP